MQSAHNTRFLCYRPAARLGAGTAKVISTATGGRSKVLRTHLDAVHQLVKLAALDAGDLLDLIRDAAGDANLRVRRVQRGIGCKDDWGRGEKCGEHLALNGGACCRWYRFG